RTTATRAPRSSATSARSRRKRRRRWRSRPGSSGAGDGRDRRRDGHDAFARPHRVVLAGLPGLSGARAPGDRRDPAPAGGGPAEWFDEWLAMEKYRVPGHSGIARWLVNEGARRGLALAYLREMQYDDGISVPTHYLNPDAQFKLVPVTMNCTVPPIPTPERAYHVGTLMREMLRAYPGDERIAVVATGGLSHEPGGPRYFWVDEEFDRWFLDFLKRGDHAALLRECTLELMEEAGSGGTAELLAWVLV